ncbi:Holliday junction resolvase [Candidatus Woesearchaeota archaeon]|nr:Holliday junction resolvase [Candidatus Woesearchaeota archaeon]
MSLKSKGINAERDLVHKFWEFGWACIRVAGSGSSKYPSPDLLAGNNLRKFAIETKTTSGTNQYFSKKEIIELKDFAGRFGAESWVAIKFKGCSWFFLSLEDLVETGKGFSASKSLCERRGLLFEELTRGF